MGNSVQFMTKNFQRYDQYDIDSYKSVGGFQALEKALNMDKDDICQALARCGIKGRGGAAYDMGRKWTQAKSEKGPEKVVICNADEGEPCTFKDRTLIENDPFRLIEAMIIAGYTVGAQNGYIYMREEYSHLRGLLHYAIDAAAEAGYLGEQILGKPFSYNIHLYSGAGAYVCGEGTALVESIEGKSGRPRMKPPYIKQCGLYHLPTCVNNVESLCLVPGILLEEDVYVTYGTSQSMGTKMVSVAGNVNTPGAFEIPFGMTVREIIEQLAGGVTKGQQLNFIQFGGASGKVASANVLDTPYSYEDLGKAGVGVGSGAILVVDQRTSLLEFLQQTQRFFSHESCGQCTPCREGNKHIKEILDRIATKSHSKQDLAQLKKLIGIMKMTSLCGLGQSAQNALESAMKHFPEEFTVSEVG